MGLAEDDIRGGTGGWGLEGTMGTGSWVCGGVEEWNVDKRDRWGQVARNSPAVGMSCSRVNEKSNLQARVPVDCCWGTVVSSSSSSEGKKSDGG